MVPCANRELGGGRAEGRECMAVLMESLSFDPLKFLSYSSGTNSPLRALCICQHGILPPRHVKCKTRTLLWPSRLSPFPTNSKLLPLRDGAIKSRVDHPSPLLIHRITQTTNTPCMEACRHNPALTAYQTSYQSPSTSPPHSPPPSAAPPPPRV
jgi:hypothetical protein